MKLQMYAVSYVAIRNGVLNHFPGILYAHNEHEANGIAIGVARNKFPAWDGWMDVSTSVMIINDSAISKLANLQAAEEALSKLNLRLEGTKNEQR